MQNENKSLSAEAKEVWITHLFDAPIELVFQAFTTREHLERWFAPKDCTILYKKLDIKVGGQFHSCISNPQYGDCWCIGTYKEIVRNKKIVYEITNANEKGKACKPADLGMDPNWPMTTLVSISFERKGGMTEMTLHQTVLEKIANKTGAYPSWIQMFEKLGSILEINKLEK